VTATGATALLRLGLLEHVSIVLAAAPSPGGEGLAAAIVEACEALGARVLRWPLNEGEQALAGRLRDGAPKDLLAVDAESAFTSALQGRVGEDASPRAALASALGLSWAATRTFALELIERSRAGRVVLIAPAAGDGGGESESCARAARAGLENLARTLSIEWSRYPITTVAIVPAPATAAHEVAALCAYLASPAGAYFSGCVLPLGSTRV
jgi:hypothetical protein